MGWEVEGESVVDVEHPGTVLAEVQGADGSWGDGDALKEVKGSADVLGDC